MTFFAQLMIKTHKFVLFSWIALIIVMGFLAIKLPSILQGDGFEMNGEHAEVMVIISEDFDLPADSLLLVFDNVTDEIIKSNIDKIIALGLTSDLVSPLEDTTLYKPDIAYALLHFNDDNLDMSDVVTSIREALGEQSGITLTGSAAIEKDINSASQRDLMIAEGIGLPIAIIVLIFAFGTIVASMIPLLIGISTIAISFGILTFIGGYTDLSIFVLNIIPMLGLALSIDFALLFVSRYREELAHSTVQEAVAKTIQTAGRSILFSAFCVFIGLGAMLLIRVAIFQNIAIGGMVVVLMAVISSLTLLPAILLMLGDRIEKWRVLKVKENGTDNWRKFANFVIKRPIRITFFTLILLGIALIPVKNMELTIPALDSLPESYDTRTALEKVNETFNLDEKSTVYLIASTENGWDNQAGLKKIKTLEDKLIADNLVEEVATIYSVSGIETVQEWEYVWESPLKEEQLDPLWESFIQQEQLLIPVTLAVTGASNEAQDWVRDIHEQLDVDILVGGEPKYNQEIFDEISNRIIMVVSLIIITTLIVLTIAFKSILIPIKAILMNIIGLAATFGILVYIFQYGHFGIAAGSLALIIPVLVFSLVFGLSMDYEVFLISRMQEEYYKTLDNDHATVEGLTRTSKVITSAALIMIVLTGAFAFTDVMPVKQIGVGIAIAIAIDATIIRLLLVPSLMKLLGKWNWWFPFRKIK